MSRILVVHHSADFDGVFCREVARKHFGDRADYLGWDYGDEPPNVTDDTELYLLDISIEPLMSHPRLTWIDHHKTAIDKYGPKPGLQIDGAAACRLAYQYWFGDYERTLTKADFVDRALEEPLAVRLAGEYDVWDKRDERAELLQLGLKSKELTPKWWKSLLTPDPVSETTVLGLVDRGRTINVYKESVDAETVAAFGFDVEWEGLTFLCLNTARCNSLSFKAGIKEHHDGLLGFRFDGKKYTVSLYGVPHKPDVDLSVIASKYGGGGHKQACGFQSVTLPFIQAQNNEKEPL